MYIDDAVEGILAAAERGFPGELYWLSSGVGYSFSELVSITRELGCKPNIIDVDSPGFHSRVGIHDFWASSEKLQSIGWYPKIRPWIGVERTLQWYRIGVLPQ